MFKNLKRLMAMIPRKGRYFTGLAIIALVSASINILTAFSLMLFVRAAQSSDLQVLYSSIAYMFGGLVMFMVLMPLGNWLYETAVVGGTANIRSLVFKSLMRVKSRWLDARHSGDLTSRATNDIQTAEKAYSMQLVMVIETVLEGLSSAVVMFIADWKLASSFWPWGLLTWLSTVGWQSPWTKLPKRSEGSGSGYRTHLRHRQRQPGHPHV